MSFWNFIEKKIIEKKDVAMLCVLHSEGSSPGRQGFKMAVSGDGEISGSIGGGIMEHKLVELAREMLEKNSNEFIFKKQIHSKKSPNDRSGMICSGEQSVVIFLINKKIKPELNILFSALGNNKNGTLTIKPGDMFFHENSSLGQSFLFEFISKNDWKFQEQIGVKNVLHIFGAGHVGLAFSRLMSTLGFYTKIYDNRPSLNTLEENDFADEKIILDYEKIGEIIPEGENQYVAIMTFGYRTDKLILQQLLGKKFRYLGMMGSKAKVKQLLKEYEEEGVDMNLLKNVHTPIGLPINSKTPTEIAVSIAAEIIKIKNAN